MSRFNLTDQPHRRYNPLTGEWVLVSPHRTQRPWSGQVEEKSLGDAPSYDPDCYLCPGNSRARGVRNADYASTFVFDNDFPALLADSPQGETEERCGNGPPLIRAAGERGICRVVCFSPRHDLSLAGMGVADIRRVIEVWTEQYRELGSVPFIQHVQIFENRGAMMGASNPHPHCQVWGTASIPNEPSKELAAQSGYLRQTSRCLLCDYLSLELAATERIVYASEHFVIVVPFWAVWPFETMLLSKRHLGGIDALDSSERDALAEAIQRISALYDRVFAVPFPYSMGFHQSPTDGRPHPEWHFHAHYYPPLLRSATVRKFMVGFEMLGGPQRDITPEQAAEKLRELAAK